MTSLLLALPLIASTSLAAALPVQQAAAPAATVAGVVRDGAGGAVAGASVVVRAAGQEVRAVSGPDGRFVVARPAGVDVEIVVSAPGFADGHVTVAAAEAGTGLSIVLAPAPVSAAVTVTATRGEERVGDVPASVSVITREDIQRSPAVVADDLLRQVPTFSLFRRASSLASHPTAQGVSLRGIGPSGVSRTLVLLDGVPFNDPFGGWVYWTRVPLASAERVEVVDSPASSLYGNYAMGGVINILTAAPTSKTFAFETQYGTRSSPKVDVSGSDVFGKLGISFNVTGFDTDGYPTVAADERGAVDDNASVAYGNANIKLDYTVNDRVRFFGHVGYFHESRDNGKHSTFDGAEEANDTSWTTASGGVNLSLAGHNEIQATVFGDDELFHSTFLAVPTATPPRSIGRMSLRQTVPTDGTGLSVQWSRPFGGKQVVSAGVDWRWVDGDSQENALDSQVGETVTTARISGGTQQMSGVFVQDLVKPVDRLTLTFSARVDHWRNYDAHNLETSVATGLPTANNDPSLPDRSDTVVSPHAGALYRLTDRVSIWGGVNQGFRAPTLNELYRQFRVGQVLTLANNQLGPERLLGGEGGVEVSVTPRATWRATWFDNRIKDAVSNVTLSTTPSTVTQQRQNLARTRIRGIQTDLEYRFGPSWQFSGSYLYEHARVAAVDDPAQLDIVGNYLPQVPNQRATLQMTYTNPRYVTLSVDLEAVGRQFDDDENLRTVPGESSPGLPGYAVVDLSVSRTIGHNLDAFLSVENLFDQDIIVGTLPTTIGAPRFVSGGIRVRWAGR
ncbi:MAG TPA: TonB-dependent receptor [Vicinamibacterales bacterium]|nr:TonB-dependent receptor [Vicinamibacterales bacterium]